MNTLSTKLPNISSTLPTKKITLPISGQTIRIRPFLVKEEKILIMVKEDSDATPDSVIDGIINVINACTFNEIEIETVPPADIEYLFLQIRMLSKGSTSEFRFRCKAKHGEEGKETHCDTEFPVTLDLNKAYVKQYDEHSNKFNVPGTEVMIVMKYPTIISTKKIMKALNKEELKFEDFERLILDHVDFVAMGSDDADEPEIFTNFTIEELQSWFEESIPSSVVEDIVEKFFKTMPNLQYDLEMVCPKCSNTERVALRGLENFFA